MTETFHDRNMASLLQFYLEAPIDSQLRDEIWNRLIEMDRVKCEQEIIILRDELNQLNGTQTDGSH